MTVRVLFFSLLQDVTGETEIEVNLQSDVADLGNLLEQVFQRFPDLREWESKLLLSVDCEYADRETPLSDGCEIALMPPVQGG
ncbi:MAG: MoaD/ThiS family protein [Verrucomicrobiales bacterium]|nr:MoaD/ThiS family protein [Verrucomicrobiales bacterium]